MTSWAREVAYWIRVLLCNCGNLSLDGSTHLCAAQPLKGRDRQSRELTGQPAWPDDKFPVQLEILCLGVEVGDV